MSNKLEEILAKAPNERHGFFQIQYFVVGNEPTIQGKLWQCLLELKTKKESIDSLKLQIENAKDDLEIAQIKLLSLEKKVSSEELKNKLIEIKKRKYKRAITNLNVTINTLEDKIVCIEKQIEFYIKIYNELSEYEKVKPYDDEEAQKEYWAAKLEEDINLKMLLQAPLDIELIKTILSLPDDAKVKVNLINNLNQVQKNMQQKILKNKQELPNSQIRILEP